MLDKILGELGGYTAIELVAVTSAIIYLLLASRNNRWCWPAAFFSSGLFVLVLWNAKLYMDAGLNSYYVAMAVYGWLVWSNHSPAEPEEHTPRQSAAEIHIRHFGLRFHALAILALLLLAAASGFVLATRTEAAFPYLDSLTTWGSLFATWLLAQRKVENWIYWIVLDAIGVYLYIQKDLHFTAALFVLYVVVSAYALYHWRCLMQNPMHV